MGEDAGAGDHAPVVVCKGKRSKRQRVHAAAPPLPPLPDVAVIAASVGAEAESSSFSVAEDDGWRSGADQEAASGCVTEEEEDMALCLMLLARGGGRAGPSSSLVAKDGGESTVKEGKFRSRRPADGADGEFVYECKTCGRCFPSFQALGGHRTSHKKPRLLPLPPMATTATTTTDEKKQRPAVAEEKSQTPSPHPTADPTVLAIPAVPATPPKQESATAVCGASRQQHKLGSRAHECSICGAEFASGQALGGHMRRHRPLVPASAAEDTIVGAAGVGGKEKSLLELDLNMPAPCDDAVAETTPTATFALLFPAPASALVDCHY